MRIWAIRDLFEPRLVKQMTVIPFLNTSGSHLPKQNLSKTLCGLIAIFLFIRAFPMTHKSACFCSHEHHAKSSPFSASITISLPLIVKWGRSSRAVRDSSFSEAPREREMDARAQKEVQSMPYGVRYGCQPPGEKNVLFL